MDDDLLNPAEPKEEGELDDDIDDILIPGKKKPKGAIEDESVDALADEEEEVLPEDSFDDVDLW